VRLRGCKPNPLGAEVIPNIFGRVQNIRNSNHFRDICFFTVLKNLSIVLKMLYLRHFCFLNTLYMFDRVVRLARSKGALQDKHFELSSKHKSKNTTFSKLLINFSEQ